MPPGLLCVHPHPDDETIAAGGSIARYLDEGRTVTVVTCTRGEAGENLSGVDLRGEDLVTVRTRELADALAALGGPDHHYLGFRDSGMAGTEENDHPDSFHRADLDEASGRLAVLIREVRPAVVLSDNAEGTYGHPDHVKSHAVTVRAIALAADPGWGEGDAWQVSKRYTVAFPRSKAFTAHRGLREAGLASPFGDDSIESPEDLPFGTDDALVTTTIDVRPWLERKRAALAAHRSQISADSFFLNLPDGTVELFFGTEAFVLEDGPSLRGPEDDLFAGLR